MSISARAWVTIVHWMAAVSAAPQSVAGPEPQLALGDWLFLGGGLLVALLVAWRAGVFDPRKVDGPLRIEPGRPLWPMAVILGGGMCLWFGSQVLYVAFKQAVLTQPSARSAPAAVASLAPADYAVLSTVPAVVAFLCFFAGDRVLSAPARSTLGLDARRLPRGVATGLVGLLVVMPLMLVTSELLQYAYQSVHYDHPAEHDLLRVMKEAPSPVVRWTLIAGALIAAPLFEEYVFRGFLQTFLRQLFVRPQPPPVVASIPVLPVKTLEYAAAGVESLQYAAEQSTMRRAGVWQTWAAIIATSIAFAVIHPLWTAPLIFVLSLCLGYAYERTGNLWTTITIHMLFNATSTLRYLTAPHG